MKNEQDKPLGKDKVVLLLDLHDLLFVFFSYY